MLRWGLTPEETERTLSLIEASARRGAELVKQLLTFGRGVEGERVVVQPKHLIREMVKMARETFPKAIRVASKAPSDIWPLIGDATQLHQVLLNLCINARDAMPNGGTLSLQAENLLIDEHYAAMNAEAKCGPCVLFKVSDTGPGIPPEIVDKIFDPFFTTKEPGRGTGLGLATVLGIVKSHGGFVTVRSQPSDGTTFAIGLPACPQAEPPPALQPAAMLPRGDGELVLVVDDEAGIREATRKTLERNGYAVVTAGDGTEAVALYAQHRGKIKLVLTDLMMPFFDGLALIRALKKLDPQVNVIASSGIGSSADLQNKTAELAELGVNEILSKPCTADQMLHVLRHRIQNPPGNVLETARLAAPELRADD
jgi:hypothetical protein